MIIKELRLDRAWSQEDLADVSGVSVRTIQRIEKGDKASLETLKCLAAVFETSVPDLRSDQTMTKPDPETPQATAPIELQEPAPEAADPKPQATALSDEDRAALRYVKYLRRYDDWYDDENGYDDDVSFPGGMPAAERKARRQVRDLRDFYGNAISFAVVMVILLIINLMTSPGYLWVIWPALGWGIGLAWHGWSVFGHTGVFGDDWERREVMKRLERINRS